DGQASTAFEEAMEKLKPLLVVHAILSILFSIQAHWYVAEKVLEYLELFYDATKCYFSYEGYSNQRLEFGVIFNICLKEFYALASEGLSI
ncbi:hypothetical protein ACJX0J_018149, partial [Zea mays]